ncbi:hypothetical protein [Streptomyces achromogenes]|uniref:hypothetical protein n=1 Tax=Streptomyces achromogenes TaxID=67255 RepID=UPI0036A3B71F
MKTKVSAAAALIAASVLTALAPAPALAAPQAPPCTKKHIAYLDAQNAQEDAEAKVSAAEQALDRARADRAELDKATAAGEALIYYLVYEAKGRAREADHHWISVALGTLKDAAGKHDPAATADAAAEMANIAEKTFTDANVSKSDKAYTRLKALRATVEPARNATEAPNVEGRQSDLDAARAELTDARQKARPARDTYRKCLANLV